MRGTGSKGNDTALGHSSVQTEETLMETGLTTSYQQLTKIYCAVAMLVLLKAIVLLIKIRLRNYKQKLSN